MITHSTRVQHHLLWIFCVDDKIMLITPLNNFFNLCEASVFVQGFIGIGIMVDFIIRRVMVYSIPFYDNGSL